MTQKIGMTAKPWLPGRAHGRVEKFLARFTLLCSAVSLCFGLVVLAGWILRIEICKSILPGHVAVKANTAMGFVLLGIALWIVRTETVRRTFPQRFAVRASALLVSVAGLLSFCEFSFGWELGIDQLLLTAGPEDAFRSIRPGLMSPLTALGFLLLGTTVLLLDAKNRAARWGVQLIPIMAAVLCLIGILDFVLEPDGKRTYIALPTALLLFLLAFALIFSRRQWGLGRLLASDTFGGMLSRTLLPSAVIIPILIAWLQSKAHRAGFTSEWTGMAIMVVSAGTLLGAVTVWTALIIDRFSAKGQEAQDKARHLASIVTSSTDAIISKTLDGIVTSWNSAAEQIYGFSAQEMVGRSLALVIPPDRLQEFHSVLGKIAEGETVSNFETVRSRKSGQIFDVAVSVSPIRDEGGRIVGASTIAHDISDRKHAEEELRKASKYARSLIEASVDPLVTIDRDGKITDVNRATETATGLPREQLIGTDFCEYFTQPECARRGYQQVFAEGMVRDYPLVLRNRSGAMLDVLYNATVYQDAEGQIQGVFAAARDVSERKRAEEEVRRTSQYARSLIEASLDPLVTIDRDGKITDVNQATETATGLPREQLIGTDFCEYFTEPVQARRGYQQVFAEGMVRDYPLVLRSRSGATIDVLYNATVYRDNQGQIEGVFAAARDISEQKKIQDKLRQQAALLDLAHDAIVVRSLDGSILFWSRGATDLYGWNSEEALGKMSQELLQTRFPESLDALQKTIQESREWEGELRHICRNGKQIVAASRWSLLRDEEGKPSAIMEINRDISDRKHAEDELRKASLYTRSLIEASMDPLVTIDRDGKITDVNQATEKVTGVPRERLVGSDFSGYFTDPEQARSGYREVFARGFVQDYPLAIRHGSGAITDVLYNASLFRNEDGTVEGVFAAARDITAQKKAEEEVRKLNQELELRVEQRTAELQAANKELEAFSYSVSHDLRAPLRAIDGFSRILVEDFGPKLPNEAQEHLDMVRKNALHMGTLIDDLLKFSRLGRQGLRKTSVNLMNVVNYAREDLVTDFEGRQVEFVVHELPTFVADAQLLRQVFMNLISNALKYTRKREIARIEIGSARIEELRQEKPQEMVLPEVSSDVPVYFVRDNGVGFDMRYADKLFGVFQRLHSREEFEGTGVGLATVQRIIYRHGGVIWPYAEMDKGATFYFTLAGAAPQGLGAAV